MFTLRHAVFPSLAERWTSQHQEKGNCFPQTGLLSFSTEVEVAPKLLAVSRKGGVTRVRGSRGRGVAQSGLAH